MNQFEFQSYIDFLTFHKTYTILLTKILGMQSERCPDGVDWRLQVRIVFSMQRVSVCCTSPTVSGFSRVHASPARSLHWFRSNTKRGPNVACHLEANAPHQLGRRHEWATLVHTERQRHRGMDSLLGGRASVAAPGTFTQGHAPADKVLRQPGRSQSSSGEGTWGVIYPGRACETEAANVGERGSSHHGPSFFSSRIHAPHSTRKRVRLKPQVVHNAAMARVAHAGR
jgi:hypothetical protein